MNMNNKTFGELTFSTGWKANTNICLYDTNFNVVIKVKAYHENEGVTSEQEFAYADFKENKHARLATVEKLLNVFANGDNAKRFIPRTLLFRRDGGYALLCDDKQDEDGGIAVCLAPKAEVVAQDEYL